MYLHAESTTIVKSEIEMFPTNLKIENILILPFKAIKKYLSINILEKGFIC